MSYLNKSFNFTTILNKLLVLLFLLAIVNFNIVSSTEVLKNSSSEILQNYFSGRAESDSSGPVLVVSGQDLQYNLTVQILISVFLVLAYLDFIFQTCLFIYVFFQLIKTLKKWSEFGWAIFGIGIFLTLRMTFVPFLIKPIPWDFAPTLPDLFVSIAIYINTGAFILFYGLAAFACIYYFIFVGVTGKKLKGSIIDAKTYIEPMVVILMPIYNEEPDALFRAVESAIRCNYRADRLHVFLAFDEASETTLYFALLKKLRVLSKQVSEEIKSKMKTLDEDENEMPNMEIFPPRLEWYIEGVRVTICRFPHEGKSPTQGKGFAIINDLYGSCETTASNTLILFIDSDIILHENAIHNFVVEAVRNPKIKGMTGLVTCRTSRNFNIYQYMQDSEYIDGQMFSRTAEASLGAVTCLPGALTLIRLNALQKVAPKYFIEIDKRRTVDFHRFHLGEDRYMTYLLTEEADGPYQVRFVSAATCKTDAPDTFQKLLKQRRRWFLGGYVNDISTMISPVMWKQVPFVVLMKIHFYSSRGIDWIFPVMIIALSIAKNPGLALYLLLATFLVRYFLLCLSALIMTRNKVCFSYILLFFISPFFNWMVTIYAVWTWNTRSWGGPRTDGDQEEISKLQLLEEAMAQKEEAIGKTRKSLGQIKTAGRIMGNNLREYDNRSFTGNPFGSMRSVRSERSNNSGKSAAPAEAPIKKFVPFPYEVDFLGGGNFNDPTTIISPPSPTLSVRSLRPPVGHSPFLAPNSPTLQQSHSMPDLHTLSQTNAPYIFAKLDPETQRSASSFRLDTNYLARVENLATFDTSSQRESTFNQRLSGRSTPTGMGSREPSIFNFELGAASADTNYYSSSRVSSLSGSRKSSVVDIIIQVPLQNQNWDSDNNIQ